jgi:arylsulfatase A-like enzyme
MQGADLSGVLLGKTEQGPDAAYFQIFGPYHAGGVEHAWRGIRTAQYMYARWESGPWLLYDLEQDPYELKNLAGEPSAHHVLQELDRQLTAWMSRVGDSWKLDWTEPLEDGGRLYNYRTFYTVDEYFVWAKKYPNLARDKSD